MGIYQSVQAASVPMERCTRQEAAAAAAAAVAPIERSRHYAGEEAATSSPIERSRHYAGEEAATATPIERSRHYAGGEAATAAPIERSRHYSSEEAAIAAVTPIERSRHYAGGEAATAAPIERSRHYSSEEDATAGDRIEESFREEDAGESSITVSSSAPCSTRFLDSHSAAVNFDYESSNSSVSHSLYERSTSNFLTTRAAEDDDSMFHPSSSSDSSHTDRSRSAALSRMSRTVPLVSPSFSSSPQISPLSSASYTISRTPGAWSALSVTAGTSAPASPSSAASVYRSPPYTTSAPMSPSSAAPAPMSPSSAALPLMSPASRKSRIWRRFRGKFLSKKPMPLNMDKRRHSSPPDDGTISSGNSRPSPKAAGGDAQRPTRHSMPTPAAIMKSRQSLLVERRVEEFVMPSVTPRWTSALAVAVQFWQTADRFPELRDRAVRLAYTNFFASHPEYGAFFPGGYDQVATKVQHMFTTLVQLAITERIDVIERTIDKVGRRHAKYGIPSQAFGHFATAFEKALAEVFPLQFNARVRFCMLGTLSFMSARMCRAAKVQIESLGWAKDHRLKIAEHSPEALNDLDITKFPSFSQSLLCLHYLHLHMILVLSTEITLFLRDNLEYSRKPTLSLAENIVDAYIEASGFAALNISATVRNATTTRYEVARRKHLAQFTAGTGAADADHRGGTAKGLMPPDLFAGPLKEVSGITTTNAHLWAAFRESDLFAELREEVDKARAESCRRVLVAAKRSSIARSTPLVRMSVEEEAAAAAGFPIALFSKRRPAHREGELEYATAVQSNMSLS